MKMLRRIIIRDGGHLNRVGTQDDFTVTIPGLGGDRTIQFRQFSNQTGDQGNHVLRQLFICHKEAFYDLYRGWPDEKRAYVAEFLSTEYQVDKAGMRAALFGHEEPMAPPEPSGPPPLPGPDLIERVGPWGAVRRG